MRAFLRPSSSSLPPAALRLHAQRLVVIYMHAWPAGSGLQTSCWGEERKTTEQIWLLACSERQRAPPTLPCKDSALALRQAGADGPWRPCSTTPCGAPAPASMRARAFAGGGGGERQRSASGRAARSGHSRQIGARARARAGAAAKAAEAAAAWSVTAAGGACVRCSRGQPLGVGGGRRHGVRGAPQRRCCCWRRGAVGCG